MPFPEILFDSFKMIYRRGQPNMVNLLTSLYFVPNNCQYDGLLDFYYPQQVSGAIHAPYSSLSKAVEMARSKKG